MDTSTTALMHGMGPTPLNLDAVPAVLKKHDQWVLWRYEGKKGKVPYQINGKHASVSDLTTWSSFEAAVKGYQQGGFDGIGFVFTEGDPFCGIDLDKCRDPATGEVAPWAQDIVDKMGSYAESSPSGGGLHIIVRATQKEARRKGGVEIYPHGRFFTMTGQHLEGTPTTIEDADKAVAELVESLSTKSGPGKDCLSVGISDIDWDADPKIIDQPLQELLETDVSFRRTWEHERDDLADQSLSTYDMSLVSQAALHHGWGPTELHLLLRRHRQHYDSKDAKWRRRD